MFQTATKTSDMLLGALVSDAACLGVHWIYDAERIADIAARQGGHCAFTPVDAANFAGVKGYFAHGARRNGMLTQYGEVLRLTIRHIATEGGFDTEKYQTGFAAHFGPGGGYHGYIDRPTRGALDNIAAERAPSGIDDDQNPAIARLPAIMARYHGSETLAQKITDAMQVTNVNAVAALYGAVFADLLGRVMRDAPLQDALAAAARNADPSIRDGLQEALAAAGESAVDFAGRVGRACHLPTSGPVMFHILGHSASYAQAVERNALAGGDSAGRSLLIGAVMGRVHGIATPRGIPLDWVLKLEDAAGIWADCTALGRA